MITTQIAPNTVTLTTRIPAGRSVDGLEYGSFVSHRGHQCYYVRPIGGERWGLARETQSDDELEDDIVAAIRREIDQAA